jgi:hypothetical protein
LELEVRYIRGEMNTVKGAAAGVTAGGACRGGGGTNTCFEQPVWYIHHQPINPDKPHHQPINVTAGAQAFLMDYPQGERAITHHVGPVRIGGC